jgi:hypothetical protein
MPTETSSAEPQDPEQVLSASATPDLEGPVDMWATSLAVERDLAEEAAHPPFLALAGGVAGPIVPRERCTGERNPTRARGQPGEAGFEGVSVWK